MTASSPHGAVLRLALLVLLAAGCGGLQRVPTPPVVEADPASVELSLFLIGDAGAPAVDEPVLTALTSEIRQTPGSSAVVYLGDNIYPRGMPPASAPMREEAERRLRAQMEVGLQTRTPTYFVPGNHDWGYMTVDGLASIRRQGEYIDEHGEGIVQLRPRDGCPGPEYEDLSPNVRLVMLDTQWWLHTSIRPEGEGSPCEADTELEVVNELNRILVEAGDRHVIIAAHHPLRTGGRHGGSFGLSAHIFPLRELADWLYIPVPVLGSAYALQRSQAGPNQDVSGPLYERLRRALDVVLSRRQPLVYAAGHDHNIQVIEGDEDDVRWHIVSGSGIYAHVTRVTWLNDTRYAAPVSGYVRLDFLREGQVRLGVRVVNAEGGASERFSMYLVDEEEAAEEAP